MNTNPASPWNTPRPAVLMAAGITLLSALLAGCNNNLEATEMTTPPPPAVDVAELSTQSVTLWDAFTGHVAATESVALRPRVSGYIDAIHFQEGELVEQGQLLFVIDPRPYQAQERAAQAGLQRAESVLSLARSEAQRARSLFQRRAISQEELDQRLATQAGAEAGLAAARAELDSAQLDLEFTRVTAPIRGRVSRAQITQGNLATADQTLLTTLVSVDPVFVYFEIDQATYYQSQQQGYQNQPDEQAFFGPGDEIRVGLTGEPGFPHRAVLDFVDNQLNRQTGTLQYRARLANPGGRFKPGQFARVEIPIEHLHQALLVDQKAVMTDQDRRFVYVVGADNTVARRDVQTRHRVQGKLVIEQGLSAGDRVIVNGLQRIPVAGVLVTPELVITDTDDARVAVSAPRGVIHM
ncbi:efflux RND transporter periplasmic adaptor subunit [Ketobacter sp.]|uniref:efflux RND transporter periplasmic adaptor subunit n=1 Tax=Ketobacter sp. TaxID=2083498 RepID=UPI000F22AA1E|nr:efflux RND transporter periplasmic adaptor subunit [Ketobacter sp.]RLT99276.1 MAG: efflux RND transporter periplasmic adaptor subunit [Ketobacter sp.]